MRKILFIAVVVGACFQAFLLAKSHWYQWVQYDPKAQIVMYGRPGCSSCEGLRGEMDKNNISYDFVNVDADPAANEEMWRIVREAHGLGVQFKTLPAVILGDAVLISPRFSELSKLYGEQRWVVPTPW